MKFLQPGKHSQTEAGCPAIHPLKHPLKIKTRSIRVKYFAMNKLILEIHLLRLLTKKKYDSFFHFFPSKQR